MFSLVSPRIHTIYHFQYKKEITLNYIKFTAIGLCSKGLKNEVETAVVNEPSVFEQLKFYCVSVVQSFANLINPDDQELHVFLLLLLFREFRLFGV